jgi:ABC-2 type transport system permease protein
VVKEVFKLLALSAKMDLASLLRDTATISFGMFTDIITSVSAITGVFLLAWRFDGIGGMCRYEVLFMLAFATIISGLYMIFFGNNNGHISRRIGRGQFEHMFVQPRSLPVQLATDGFYPFSCGYTFIFGVITMSIAVVNLEITLSWWWVFAVVGYLIVSLSIVVGFLYLAGSLAFYAPVQAEEISSHVFSAFEHIGRFPLSGMPRYLKFPLLTLAPTGLLAWFPTLALLGRPPLYWSPLYPLIFAIFLWMVALYFFRKGLRYYAKKGINRYSDFGRS